MGVESIKYGDICDKCAHVEYCDMATFGGHNPRITACPHFSQSKQTNADCIRAMTDEELANFIAVQRGRYCDFKDPSEEEYPKVLLWLKSPAEVVAKNADLR